LTFDIREYIIQNAITSMIDLSMNILLDKIETFIGLSPEKSRIQLIQETLKKIGRE
jgi:hypothetical protein